MLQPQTFLEWVQFEDNPLWQSDEVAVETADNKQSISVQCRLRVFVGEPITS